MIVIQNWVLAVIQTHIPAELKWSTELIALELCHLRLVSGRINSDTSLHFRLIVTDKCSSDTCCITFNNECILLRIGDLLIFFLSGVWLSRRTTLTIPLADHVNTSPEPQHIRINRVQVVCDFSVCHGLVVFCASATGFDWLVRIGASRA